MKLKVYLKDISGDGKRNFITLCRFVYENTDLIIGFNSILLMVIRLNFG